MLVQVGKQAPDFQAKAVVDGRLKEISLSSYTEANHWLVLVFFPKAWSFICPTEIKAFSARLDEFLYKRHCAVAFCSTDNEHALKAWNGFSEMEGGLGGVHVPLISDSNHKICNSYHVLIEDEGVAQRALFIIDPKGIVRNITCNDADIGRSVDETLRIVDALIFKDEFGEGCPIDWKKGDQGIDVKTKTSVDGPIEVVMEPSKKATLMEWARPKLQRAFSGTSQHSIQTVPPPRSVSLVHGHERTRSHSNLASTVSSNDGSPLVSPTKAGGANLNGISAFEKELDDAINAQKNAQATLDNIQAAMANQAIGVAN